MTLSTDIDRVQQFLDAWDTLPATAIFAGQYRLPRESLRAVLRAAKASPVDPDLGGGPMGLPMSPPERFGDS